MESLWPMKECDQQSTIVAPINSTLSLPGVKRLGVPRRSPEEPRLKSPSTDKVDSRPYI